MLRLWNSQDCETVLLHKYAQRTETMKQSGKFDLEGQGQLPPKTTGILTKLFYTSGPNFVILAWMSNLLWCGQAQNGVNSDF